MSRDSIKLTDAIAGNRTWLNRAKGEHSELCRKGHELLAKAKRLSDEMEAREAMATTMERVQRLMPADETITFLVPCDSCHCAALIQALRDLGEPDEVIAAIAHQQSRQDP